MPHNTLTEHPIYGTSRLGVYKRKSKTSLYQLTDHLGNVRAVIAKKGSNAAALVAKTDYYPGGMAMPNKNVKGDYRYNYQGQEQDEETGHHAFELRMYDSRINRWLSPDPYGQFHSPYLAMGNDWPNSIDKDGGWRSRRRAMRMRQRAIDGGLKNVGELTKVGKHWGFNSSRGTGTYQNGKFLRGIEVTFNFTKAFSGSLPSSISGDLHWTSNLDFWRNQPADGGGDALLKVLTELTYGSAENVYGLFAGRTFSGTVLRGQHGVDAGVDGIVTLATAGLGTGVKAGLKTLKSSSKLYNGFAKSTRGMFKGPNHNQLRAKAYREMIKNHNHIVKDARKANKLYKEFQQGSELLDEINSQN